MHKILVFIVGIAALTMASCQAPLSLHRQSVNLALTVSYTTAHLPTTSTQARLLLPTASYVQLTLKDSQGNVTLYTQAISSTSSAVFSLSNLTTGDYTVSGQGFADAALTTSLFANSIKATISTSTTALKLYLLPTSSATIAAGTPVTGTLASNASATFLYTLSSASDSLTLNSLPAGVSYYLQNSDGTTVADSSGAIAANATDGILLLTLYNSTAKMVPYNFSVKESGINLGVPQWAVTTTGAYGVSTFNATAVDGSGSVLEAGTFSGNYSFAFGGFASLSGLSSVENPLIVKMSSSGNVLWAQSGGGSNGDNFAFTGVSTDASNNVYAVGTTAGTKGDTYTFGSSPSVTTTPAASSASILVKFDSAGNPAWAISSSSIGGDTFTGVAADASGNSWAVGSNSNSAGSIAYGTGAQGTVDGSGDLVIAKFNTTGSALWISACYSSLSSSRYNGVAVDSSGNSYAAGAVNGTAATVIGTASNNVSVSGSCTAQYAVLVKYSPSGVPLWAVSPPSGGVDTVYNAVCVDNSGNSVVVGSLLGGGAAQNFGNGQVLTGGDTMKSDTNVVIVKYDTNGNTLWARTVSAAAGASTFTSVSVDSLGNCYAVGTVTGTGSGVYTFGSQSITVPSSITGTALVIVKYNADGTVQWVKTVSNGTSTSQFSGVAVDRTSGNVFAVGNLNSNTPFDCGNSVTATGYYSSGTNALVVQYQ